MPDLHIRREHQLGLEAARAVAEQWREDAQRRLGMQCALSQDDERDTLSFSRTGVRGTLVVDATSFEMRAQLGFLLAGFAGAIRSEIERKLDELLGSGAGPGSA